VRDHVVTEKHTPLSAALWDLRAQVEAELRCLTKVHRLHDGRADTGDKARIIAELRDVLRINNEIRTACELAIATADELDDDW
jgi:hypothetical protein